MDYRRFFDDAITKLKGERRYRVFADLARDAAAYPRAVWRRGEEAQHSAVDVVVWCSNDYLCMGRHPQVIEAMTRAGGGAWRRLGRYPQYFRQ